VTGSHSRTVIALKTTHCVLGSVNRKVSVTIGVDGGSQTPVLLERQQVLFLLSQPPHPFRHLQAAVIIELMVRVLLFDFCNFLHFLYIEIIFDYISCVLSVVLPLFDSCCRDYIHGKLLSVTVAATVNGLVKLLSF